MKKEMLTLAFVLLSPVVAGAQSVITIHTNNENDSYNLKNVKRITFLSDGIGVDANDETKKYDYEVIDIIDFSKDVTGIYNTNTPSCSPFKRQGFILINEGKDIRIYNAAGKLQVKGNSKVNIETLTEGIYVAVSDNNTIKIKR